MVAEKEKDERRGRVLGFGFLSSAQHETRENTTLLMLMPSANSFFVWVYLLIAAHCQDS